MIKSEELVRFLLESRKHLKPEQRTAFLNLEQTRLAKALGGPAGPLGGRRGPWRGGPGMGRGQGLEPPPGPGPEHGACPPGCPD